VWAFEPNPENYRCALITILLNGLQNVELTNAGLGAEKGQLAMEVSDAHGKPLGGGSRLARAATQEANKDLISIDVVTVDDTVPADREVAILQLDVEGFEEYALAGAAATIRRCKPLLILEHLPKAEWLEENVLPLGYKAVGKVHDSTVFRFDRP
jgi:FkbM family methyltransferase